jgi:ATP-dependent RNA helicase RhlE
MSEEIKTTPKKYFDPVSIASRTRQGMHKVADHDKMAMLAFILNISEAKQSVVICKSKKRADELSIYLNAENHKAKVIHGNHRKSDYTDVAKAFISNEINLLITTDMVLQQLELTNVERIFSFDIPNEPENYFKSLALVDEKGESISLMSPSEEGLFTVIEMLLKIEIAESEVEGFVPSEVVEARKPTKDKKKKPRHRSKKKEKQSPKEDSE